MTDDRNLGMDDDARIAAMPAWLGNCLPGPGTFAERLSGPFPWVRVLDAEDRAQFADELVTAAGVVAGPGALAPIELLISQWEASASALTDGLVTEAGVDWLEEFIEVERPGRPD